MGIPRQFHTAQIHYLRRDLTFADNGIERFVGAIPAGSLIIRPISGVFVSQAFNAGTTNTLNVGTEIPVNDDDLLGTLLALGTVGTFVALDENVTNYLVTADTDITATVVLTGAAATAGRCQVVIAYVPPGL